MAPVGPWAQPKATRREGGRRAERPAGSYATPDTPCSRTAPESSLPTERGQTVPALRPELDDPNKFGSSNHSAPADRSPRRAAGRAASVVAVPLAFFGTFFRVERKYCPPRGGSPTVRAGVGASVPPARDSLTAKLPCVAISRGLFARPLHSFGSPTETPKHPVPRRSRRVMLHPWASGMRLRAHKRDFRSPFGNLRAPKVAEPHRTTNSNPRRSQRVQPRRDCLTRKLLFAAASNGLSTSLCPLGPFILFLLNPHPAAALSFPQR